jgi:hypothetical protein
MGTVIEWMLQLLGICLTIGLLFAIPFAFRGTRKIDPSAVEGTWGVQAPDHSRVHDPLAPSHASLAQGRAATGERVWIHPKPNPAGTKVAPATL